MIELKVQNYLRLGNTLESLTEKYAITVKRHKAYTNLVMLKYNQIDSPMSEEIVQDCRGIILDENDDWKIRCLTYRKFFNYGDPNGATIDWSTARCMEKADGSLIQLFWYNDKWIMTTSGTPDGECNVGCFDITFKDLFWKVWAELGYEAPSSNWKNYCFAFELCTPYNKIIVQHQKNDLILHGCRDLDTLEELDVNEELIWQGMHKIKEYPMNNISDIINSCSKINPIEHEGYVVVDKNFNRLKVKSPQYVALSHIKDSMSVRRMVEIVATNENEEFLAYFPEFTDLYNDARAKYNELVKNLYLKWDKIKNIENQKEFALEAIKTKCSGALFAMRKGQVKTVKEYLAKIPSKNLVETLNLKEMVI